jgi:hypothetical protein
LDAADQAGLDLILAAYGFGMPERFVAKIEKFEELLNL